MKKQLGMDSKGELKSMRDHLCRGCAKNEERREMR